MEIIIIEKSTFNVLNFKNCSAIVYNGATHDWQITIPSGNRHYDSEVYDVRIIG